MILKGGKEPLRHQTPLVPLQKKRTTQAVKTTSNNYSGKEVTILLHEWKGGIIRVISDKLGLKPIVTDVGH